MALTERNYDDIIEQFDNLSLTEQELIISEYEELPPPDKSPIKFIKWVLRKLKDLAYPS